MEYSKKMLNAVSDTIRAYEQAILDIGENGRDEGDVFEAWSAWGYENVCRLCNAAGETDDNGYKLYDCRSCPLGPEFNGCLGGGRFWNVHEGVGVGRGGWVKHLKARLAWMIKKIGKNGLEVID